MAYNRWLCHYGVKGMKWGVRRDRYISKNYKKANNIYDTLTDKEKYFVTAEKGKKEYVTKDEYHSKNSQNLFSSIEQDKGKPVSVIDLWEGHDKQVDVSIAVRNDPKYRGKGYASRAVERGIQWFNEHPEYERLVWGVDVNNQPSINLAKKHGFKVIDEHWEDWMILTLERH